MFERFRARYAPIRVSSPTAGVPWLDQRLLAVRGYREFAGEFAGASFGDGLYRIHDERSGSAALSLVVDAFPDLGAQACPFAYDWLGRQFVVDAGRAASGQPQVLLVEPGTGEALEIPESFATFHEEELLDFADSALAIEFFEAWSAANRGSLPLRRDQCVGYRVPLFLGGKDVVENLELTDLDIYWSICGQLRLGALRLSPGTTINQLSGH